MLGFHVAVVVAAATSVAVAISLAEAITTRKNVSRMNGGANNIVVGGCWLVAARPLSMDPTTNATTAKQTKLAILRHWVE